MKLVKFSYKSKINWGVVKKDMVTVLKAPPFKRIKGSAKKIPLKDIKFLAPAISTSKIILVGLNYKDHARELKMKIPKDPVIFLKPYSSLVGHKDNIQYPKMVKRLDFEAELAVIVKKEAKNIKPADVNKIILGYTCLNDVTARDLQAKDGQWTRAKSFDTFCPLGPWIETNLNPKSLGIKLFLNNKLKQNSNTKNFIFSIRFLISYISKIMTLMPGDVISSGTPVGVGRMKKGDEVKVVIERVGELINFVR